jgi:biotin-dependent carboxylase-like uncharacterized protein
LLAPGDTVRFVGVDALPAATITPHAHRAQRDTAAPSLHVVEPGLLTTVQDAGRRGHQRIGVPTSGALDREYLHVANLLAGNAPGDAALEVTHTGPVLDVHAPSIRVAIAGDAEVTRITRDGRRIATEPWRSMILRDGERLHVGRVMRGLRCIVAVEGGIDVEPVLGSRSTCLRAGFGGFDGRALQRGDVLPLQRAYAGLHPDVRLDPAALQDNTSPIRVVLGPQADSIDGLLQATLTVAHRSDRVGLRLDGIRLQHAGSPEITSDGCASGSVQVPGSGQPIVLLADRGTTGGYPKVATVASVDLPRLARLRPGDTLRFEAIDVLTAEQLRRQRDARLHALADALQPVPPE